MLNILYLMPQMDSFVSSEIRKHFLEHSPESIVARWLGSLYQKNEKYLKAGFTPKELDDEFLPIKLPPHTAVKVYGQLCKIRKLLQRENITHSAIFESLCPTIHQFYTKSRDSVSMITSLKNLYKAAGGDANLVQSLYSRNQSISTQAWSTISFNKRKIPEKFKNLFSQDIKEAAEEFISHIDFASENEETINDIANNLKFVKSLTLFNVKLEQIQQLCAFEKIQPKVIKLKAADNTEEREKWVRENLKSEIIVDKLEGKKVAQREIKLVRVPRGNRNGLLVMSGRKPEENSTSDSTIQKAKLEPEDVETISRDSMIQKIRSENIQINSKFQNGNTALHNAVMNGQLDLIELYLDLGIDSTILNNENKTAVELSTSQSITETILNYEPKYFWTLIKEDRVEEATMIAKTIASKYLLTYSNDELVDNQKPLLEFCLAHPKYKSLALVVVERIEEVKDLEYAHMCVMNYKDQDVDLLEALVKKNPNLLSYRDKFNKLAVDVALKNRKEKMAVSLINKGSDISIDDSDNIKLILQAVKWGIVIDAPDITNQFDYGKKNKEGDTIFDKMCMEKNKAVFKRYKDKVIPDYLSKDNEQSRKLKSLAEDHGFVEMLELIYGDQELYIEEDSKLYHRLAKGSMKKLSNILKDCGIVMSIREAVEGVNFATKANEKGNTVLQLIIKQYIKDRVKEKNIDQIKFEETVKALLNEGASIHQTKRRDENTALHLAARHGDEELVQILVGNSAVRELPRNREGQTAIQFAEMYGHSKVVEVINNWFKDEARSRIF